MGDGPLLSPAAVDRSHAGKHRSHPPVDRIHVSSFHSASFTGSGVWSTGSAEPLPEMPGTTWTRMAAVMVANILGTGVLSLPHAASKLGWLPFSGALVLFTAGALYSGAIYSRLYSAVPSALVLADVATAGYGRVGTRVVSSVVYLYVGGVTIIFHLTCSLAVQQLFSGTGVCAPWLSLAVAGPVLALLQFREMHSVGGLAILGSVAIFVPCIVVLAELLNNPVAGAQTELVASDASLVQRGVSVMDVVFAYAGQVIFIELQSDMAAPETFPRAVYVSTGVMVAVYGVVACVGYWALGAHELDDGKPITSDIHDQTALRVINWFLAVHVLIAYVVEANVLSRGICWMMDLEEAVTGTTRTDRMRWLSITSSIVATAFVVSNVLPFFSAIMGLMAAMCSILLTYTFPILLLLKLCHVGPKEKAVCYVLIPLSLMLALAGTVASVADIISKLNATPPFSCNP